MRHDSLPYYMSAMQQSQTRLFGSGFFLLVGVRLLTLGLNGLASQDRIASARCTLDNWGVYNEKVDTGFLVHLLCHESDGYIVGDESIGNCDIESTKTASEC